MKINKSRGISLIVLVITIIVIIILAAAVILTLNKNNPLENANEATVKSDLKNFQEQLAMYAQQKSAETLGEFQLDSLNASETRLAYNTQKEGEKGTIYDIIPDANKRYQGQLEIVHGKLVFSSKQIKQLTWVSEIGIDIDAFEIENGVLKSANATLLLLENNGTLNIPGNVWAIDSGAFHDIPNLKKVVIPSTVKEIRDHAFSNNASLESVIIENGVEKIGAFAFSVCPKIETISIPDSVTLIGNSCFMYCTSLSNLKISKNIKKIEYRTFSGCSSLKNIIIPDKVECFDPIAIEYCSKITTLNIPANVSVITNAFTNTPSLKSLTIDPNNKNYCCENGVLYNKEKTYLYSVLTNVTNIDIPNTVVEIGSSAFGIGSIKKLHISASVAKLNGISFPIQKLESLTIDPANPYYTADNLAVYTKDMCNIINFFGNADNFTIPQGVKVIDSYCFYGSGLRDITLPDSIETIGGWAFTGLGLPKLIIPKNVRSISNASLFGAISYKVVEDNPYIKDFNGNMILSKDGSILYCVNSSASSITVPSSVIDIASGAFYSQGVKEVIIPMGVKTIGGGAFDACSNLIKINIPSSMVTINSGAFSRCESLKTIDVDATKGKIAGAPWAAPGGDRVVVWK
ncbi:MAG: leucine-rich repeat domain-containing protein [Clostridia bacterium]